MHITMLAVGSRGDVQPFVALGLGLKQAGYGVRLATHQIFESFVTGYGLEFAPLEGDPQAVVGTPEGRAWLESQRNPFQFAGGFRKFMGPIIRRAMHDALLAAEGTDAIIVTGSAFYFGDSVAAKLGVPFIQAYAQPVHPTGEFSSALFPVTSIDHWITNYLTHQVGGMTIWQLMRPLVNDARREFLDLGPVAFAGTFLEHYRRRLPVVYGYSPSVIPKPANWKDFLHVTGYWFLDHPQYEPPADLQAFLAAGPAPVYIGFGSMAGTDPEQTTEIVLSALRRSGQRAILLTGWGGLTQSDLPDSVFKIETAPHDWLFPRMAAVVHHGGAGTTAAGLRAGKPTIIMPFFGDQPFWAQRVTKLGVGQHLNRKKLTVEGLAQALALVARDAAIRERAAALGQRIRAEDGIGNATRVIDAYLSTAGRQTTSVPV